jgi:hypothetical protein
MGNSRSRARLCVGGEVTWREYLGYIHTVFDGGPVDPEKSPESQNLEYLAQVFILDTKYFELGKDLGCFKRNPGSFKTSLEAKIKNGDTPTANQATAIALAKAWDNAVTAARSSWELLQSVGIATRLVFDSPILRACRSIKLDSPDRYLNMLEQMFKDGTLDTVKIKSDFGISREFGDWPATTYLAKIYLSNQINRGGVLPGEEPLITKLIRELDANPSYEFEGEGNRQKLCHFAMEWDIAVLQAAKDRGRISTVNWRKAIQDAKESIESRRAAEHASIYKVSRPPPQ